MSTIVTMTLDEIRKLPQLTEEDKKRINEALCNPDEECPAMTPEQLKASRPAYLRHPELYKPRKTSIHLRVDADVLAEFKKQGKGYQTRMNEVLRKYVFG